MNIIKTHKIKYKLGIGIICASAPVLFVIIALLERIENLKSQDVARGKQYAENNIS